MIKRQTGNIKIVRSDNGTEYVNHSFKDHFKKEGIIHETSASYTPEQNGKAERDLRSIVESARSMLTQSGLPINLWAEATNMAVYLLNRRPSKPDDSKTPNERWIGKQPDLRHLRTFGSEAFVLVPKHQRHKFDRKSMKQYLVGYDGYSPNYRVY
ncbi:hypothetical protein JTB14_010141 [Gonioctena quinquepunctata]|nr:hypothetical protein JTB14_010141 [Gonioctena quinquepunctata]